MPTILELTRFAIARDTGESRGTPARIHASDSSQTSSLTPAAHNLRG